MELRNKYAGGIAAAALVTSLLGLGTAAQAAPGPSLPIAGSPGSVEVGVFLPSSGEAKDNGGNTQFSGFFNYTLPVPLQSSTPTTTEISLGVETGSRSGDHYTTIPLTATELVSLTGQSPNAAGAVYAGAGIGAYFINGSGLSSEVRFGGQAQLGYNITSAIFLDARYQFVQNADGLTADVGLRF